MKYSRTTKHLTTFMLLLLCFMLQPAKLNADSLYLDSVGADALTVVVDQFLHNLKQDVRLNHIFLETTTTRLREQLLWDIVVQADQYGSGATPTQVGERIDFHLNAADLALVLEHLQDAMEQQQLALSLKQRLTQKLAHNTLQVLPEYPLASR